MKKDKDKVSAQKEFTVWGGKQGLSQPWDGSATLTDKQ